MHRTRLNKRQFAGLNDEKIICQPRHKLVRKCPVLCRAFLSLRLVKTTGTIPVARLGEPEEIARAVVFLAADDAGFITGSTLSVNGCH